MRELLKHYIKISGVLHCVVLLPAWIYTALLHLSIVRFENLDIWYHHFIYVLQ